ncbi:MAG: hypothetical protein WBQ49_20690, partial [Rhodomicrobium sp.]
RCTRAASRFEDGVAGDGRASCGEEDRVKARPEAFAGLAHVNAAIQKRIASCIEWCFHSAGVESWRTII